MKAILIFALIPLILWLLYWIHHLVLLFVEMMSDQDNDALYRGRDD